ncbi:hypothetical protein BDR06DRAFT_1039924, partial [Suillus hirtellus]
MMEEDDSIDILQEILKSKILDWNPHGSKILETRGLNVDDDVGALSADFENCKILDKERALVENNNKGRRGRPRKRETRRRNKQNPQVSTIQADTSNENIQNVGKKYIIRATTSPVPQHFPTQANVVHHIPPNEPISTMSDGIEQGGLHEEDDRFDILQNIINSGIMDWNPQESWTTKHTTYDSGPDIDGHSKKHSSVMECIGVKNKPRRPRGRPAKKVITHRSKYKTRPSMNNDGAGYIIRATSNPCQRESPATIYTVYCEGVDDTFISTDECQTNDQPRTTEGPNIDFNEIVVEEIAPVKQKYNQQHRGRPKKRPRRLQVTVSQKDVIQEVAQSVVEMHDDEEEEEEEEEEDVIGKSQCSSAPLDRDRLDLDYRPTPPPQTDFRSPSLEVPAFAMLAEPTEEETSSRAMARPVVWTSAWHNWRTLESNEWLDATVANYYLCHIWYEVVDRSQMRYVDLYAAMANDMVDDEVKLFRKNHFAPQEGTCPVIPVGFIVHHSDHFFAAIFDYRRRIAHVLGRHISDTIMEVDGVDPNDWKDWGGPQYWRRIATLHGWSPGNVTDVSVIPDNWKQNGVDCGPIACSVLEQCLRTGLDKYGNLPALRFQCGHRLRIHMLQVIAGRIKLSCSDYLMLLDRQMDDQTEDDIPDEDVINAIQNGQHQAECLKLVQKLTVVGATCSTCHHSILNQNGEHPSPNGDNGDQTIADQDGLEEEWTEDENVIDIHLPKERRDNLAKLIRKNRQLAGSRNRNAIVPRAIGTHLELEQDTQPDSDNTGDSQRSVAASVSRRRVKNLNLGSSKRFPRPTAPPPLAAYRGSKWLQDNHQFDEYEGGPTIEMLMTPRDINPTMTFQVGGIQLSTAWVNWIDHGYRITPSSFHIFYQCEPIATMDHIMCVGTTNSHDPSNQVPDRVTGAYSLNRLGLAKEGRNTHISDVQILSASELIDAAQYDPPLHEECRFGHNAFVRGRTSHRFGDGPALYVDLEQDAVKFSEDELETSVDIDSIIWTTKVFRCKGSVGIYITPPFQTKPGIFKHNHTYVDITIPQSEEDANAPGGRKEWLSKRFPMSAIPHACMGRISSASSTLNLYIAFPRMIHQHPVNGRRITLMPKEVLDIFWDRVLLPSIGDCTDVSWAPYMKHTLEEARYKARGAEGRKGGWGPPKTIPLSDDDFRDVQERMEACIRNGEGELSMYGSFFFILEGKGIKLLTKDGQRGRFSGPEEALRRNLSDLDWPYMMNHRNGELLVDVGISFTPRSPEVPVVGVWRLDALEASYGAGGYKRGEIHHQNTLSRY